MPSTAEDAYLESRIFCADGVELIRILYQAAIQSVEKARRALQHGDIACRSREISRALAILAELAISVRQDVDRELGRNLVELYDYMQRRLVDANILQQEPPLAEVSRLLVTLLDAWIGCRPEEKPWEDVIVPEGEHAECVSASWSF
jgi:flagellar protein FliS